MPKPPPAKRLRQELLKFASSTATEKYNGNHSVFVIGHYECACSLRSKDVLNISLPVVSGCQALFCNSSDMATCLEQIFGRATELHDGEITMPWHDLQRYNEIILTSPQTTRMSILSASTSCRSLTVSCIAKLDERFTRQKVAACQLKAFLPAFLI